MHPKDEAVIGISSHSRSRKTGPVSSAPPAGRTSSWLVWRRAAVPFALLALALISVSCDAPHVATGPLQVDPVAVELGSTDHADLELKMGAGQLDVSGGADKLIQGEFEYNVADWKPKLSTSVIGAHTTVSIAQPSDSGLSGNPHYTWNLKLNDRAIFDVTLHMGAGQANLTLGDLQLRDVVVEIGAGKVALDLRGKPTRDYDVRVAGGVGQATIHLPQGVGVSAEVHGGLGSLTVEGLEKQGDHYQNSLYDTAKVHVHLKVDGGVGQIQILD